MQPSAVAFTRAPYPMIKEYSSSNNKEHKMLIYITDTKEALKPLVKNVFLEPEKRCLCIYIYMFAF